MRVLMLGWEFPPHLSGGLGTACLGLTRALAGLSTDITFVLPTEASDQQAAHLRLLAAAPGPGSPDTPAPASPAASPAPAARAVSVAPAPGVTLHAVPAAITSPYPDGGTPLRTPEGLRAWLTNPDGAPLPTTAKNAATPGSTATTGPRDPYAGDLLAEANAYADRCVALAHTLDFDVIHAHDWPTFPAAAAVSAATGKPWIAHVHSLESDRAGGVYQVNPQIDTIERGGIRSAHAVIAVSRRTGDRILETCGIAPDRVQVIYNGIDLFDACATDAQDQPAATPATLPDARSNDEKIVLFLGRITAQKGPGYFLDAAQRVLEKFDRVRFVLAGTGDQSHELVARAQELGISDHMLFTGFLGPEDVDRVFRIADLYVMPSVSEPFGIAPLEAIQHDVPVIISRQSGVSEVLEHVLKVDFWDTDDLASKMLAVLRNPSLAQTLRDNAGKELRRLNWREAAEQCIGVYESLRS